MGLAKRSLWAVLITMGSLSYAIANEDVAKSLCKSQENVVFSCEVRGSMKVVSLCSSKNVSQYEGYIKYRFGLPLRIEMEFPAQKKDTQQKFKYAHYWRPLVDRTEVTFKVNEHSYTIFDSYEGEGNAAERISGVSVTLPSKDQRKFLCSPHVAGTLAGLEELIPCDEENALSMGSCQRK